MSLKDINGADISARGLPNLLDRGAFEGELICKFYRDAVEYAASCFHCSGVVAGLLRLEDPKMHRVVRGWLEEQGLRRQVAEIVRARHQCPVIHEGKRDAAEWMESLTKH